MKIRAACSLAAFCLLALPVFAWQPVGDRLKTRWATDVSPERVWPEYPRPQMVRTSWTNLNGLWNYAITSVEATEPAAYQGEILVPFAIESSLSGVGTTIDGTQALWYRRTFASPPRSSGGRVLLHFGAVDWETRVYVNGNVVGEHRGGYDPFTFDITDALTDQPSQSLVVRVLDSTGEYPTAYQPRGKQSRQPGGIFYTSTSGIWQTVWLETVPATYIRSLTLVPDVDHQSVRVTVEANRKSWVKVVVFRDGTPIAIGHGQAGAEIRIGVGEPRLWSPDNPYLYTVYAVAGSDRVRSYFGMRKIEVRKDKLGDNRFFLNGEPMFLVGPLDQGFWPDGVYTAPTDEALRYDIEFEKRAGFNAVRKHVKVEPERWYYWCDKLGLLVWQDFPAPFDFTRQIGQPDVTRTGEAAQQIRTELQAMVDDHINHPSIMMWDIWNEGWGQADTAALTSLVKQIDPSRLVDSASGWNDIGTGDVLDYHNYPGPITVPAQPNRVAVQGEFGGGGLVVPDHEWNPNGPYFAYLTFNSADQLYDFYSERINGLKSLAADGVAGAIYTQITDVEGEINGLMTYDRIEKLAPERLKPLHASLNPIQPYRVIAPSGREGGLPWRYTLQNPGPDWFEPSYADSGWLLGQSGFGSQATPGIFINTFWTTADIWLRRNFDNLGQGLVNPYLLLYNDDNAEVYINGTLAATAVGYTTDYLSVPIPPGLLQPGTNLIAVHGIQIAGGQGIDVGVIDFGKGDAPAPPSK